VLTSLRMSSAHQVKYPRELAGHLLSAIDGNLAGDPSGSASGEAASKIPLPSEQVLAQILDVTYVTSLCNEEGRACAFTIAYLSPTSAAELGHGTFCFASRLPFSALHLRKLAPATDPAVTCVAVWPTEDGELGIWGLLHQGDRTFSIDREFRPKFLHVRVLRPGAFNVHHRGATIALFVTDHWHIFESRLDLLGMLRGPLADGRHAREFVRLASRMLSFGHGGTILIVDREHSVSGLIAHRAFSHPNTPSSLLKDAFEGHGRFARKDEVQQLEESEVHFNRRRRDAERAHADALDFVARLTAVDGALVMQDDLSVVGFGATIQMSAAEDPLIVLEDPRSRGSEQEVLVSTIGGNRHRSAVHFCAQQEGLALALVASQDGDLSLVGRKDDGRAHVIRPFELGEGL
jgi:hypothetical protein